MQIIHHSEAWQPLESGSSMSESDMLISSMVIILATGALIHKFLACHDNT